MQTGKLNEHVEQELFNKKKRVVPNVPVEKLVKMKEGVEPKIKKLKPTPPKTQIIKEGENPTPVKKKKPYYRNKYNKPKPVEVVVPEPVKYLFIKGLMTGLVIAGLLTILVNLIF